jgi:hypothetical protein
MNAKTSDEETIFLLAPMQNMKGEFEHKIVLHLKNLTFYLRKNTKMYHLIVFEHFIKF